MLTSESPRVPENPFLILLASGTLTLFGGLMLAWWEGKELL